jgi:hypothetical protein
VAERDGGGGEAWGGVGGQVAIEGGGDSRAELGVGAVRGGGISDRRRRLGRQRTTCMAGGGGGEQIEDGCDIPI